MKVLVTGGTGFIGQALVKKLLESGHNVRVLARHAPDKPLDDRIEFFAWDALLEEPPAKALEGAEVIFHLAGENIFGYWTQTKKRKIFDSRVLGTRNLVSAIAKATRKPKVLISASAVGYYGDKGEEELTEESAYGSDFLAELCRAWEEEAKAARSLGIRVVQMRIATVLGHGGMLAKLAPLFRLGSGAQLGSGQQWFSWIHQEDLLRAFLFVMENGAVSGPVNACSPNPARNKDFTKTLAQTLRRPAFLRVPPRALRLVFGELADAVLSSQRVVPIQLLNTGFRFQFSDLAGALKDVFRSYEK